MLNPTQTRTLMQNSPEILGGGIAALGVGAVLSLDQFRGMHASREFRTYPEFYTASPNGSRHTVGFLPGCQVEGQAVFNRIRSHSPEQNLVVVDYPQTSFNIEQVCEGLARQMLAAKAEKPSFICQSMGGIVIRHFLEYARDTDLPDKTNGFGTVVLDDAIHDAADIRLPYSALLKGAIKTRNSWIVDHAKPKVMRMIWGNEAHEFSTSAHVATAASEGEFIFRKDHPTNDYTDMVEAAYFVHGPNGDRVARTEQSIKKFQANFTSKFHDVVDSSRAPHSHTGGEPQQGSMLQLANNLRNMSTA